MRILLKTDYAMRALLDLSLHPPGTLVRVADIAERQKIPPKFLELVLATLRQSGFVEARRGTDGGYRLAREPYLISVGEVVRLLEPRARKGRPRDPFAEMWSRVDSQIARILDTTTFEDLTRKLGARAAVPPHRVAVGTWQI